MNVVSLRRVQADNGVRAVGDVKTPTETSGGAGKAGNMWEHWWEGELIHSGTYEECYASRVSAGMWGSIRPAPRMGTESGS